MRPLTYMLLWHAFPWKEQKTKKKHKKKNRWLLRTISLVNHDKQDPLVPPSGLGFLLLTTLACYIREERTYAWFAKTRKVEEGRDTTYKWWFYA